MLARWPIRNKLFLGAALLLVLVLTLSASTFYGRYAYRGLVKSLGRLNELRLVNDLVRRVSELRLTACQLSRFREDGGRFPLTESGPCDDFELRGTLRQQLGDVRDLLARYGDQLNLNAQRRLRLGGGQRELETLRDIKSALKRLDCASQQLGWFDENVTVLRNESELVQTLTGQLPGQLRQNILNFTDDVRGDYRTFLALAYLSLVLTAVVMCVLVRTVYSSVFRPLRVLVEGSRQVAAGEFDHRIRLDGKDEMAELAVSMNDMTARFLAVRDQLDRQVQERTRQIVQSERLASVGFLAAGVSHEINNPLASIAMCAESLERRLATAPFSEIASDMRGYLRMISGEAARCQGITGKLLDFSRMGDARREPTSLSRLIQEAVEVVRGVPKFHGKRIEFDVMLDLVAHVHPQEIKQVVLNLVTNALESIECDGHVEIGLQRHGAQAEIIVRDNGCGMTAQVLQHLFEPFFTQRHGGQGTGLGLSIADRIVSDHDGEITAFSAGPGQGSEFRVRLPLGNPAAAPRATAKAA
jgi:two-component system NtrC family sensor kinase